MPRLNHDPDCSKQWEKNEGYRMYWLLGQNKCKNLVSIIFIKITVEAGIEISVPCDFPGYIMHSNMWSASYGESMHVLV